MVIVTWPLGQISSACKADTLSWRQGPSLKKIIWYFLIVDKIFQGMKSATHLFILINSCSLDFHFSRTVFSNKGSILAIQLAKEKSQNIESPGMQSAEFCLWIWLDSRLLQAHMDQKCHWAGGASLPQTFQGGGWLPQYSAACWAPSGPAGPTCSCGGPHWAFPQLS